jgi:tRNA-specific 2-thiouridylase
VKTIKNKKVFVGLSGGVDSSVSIALLKKAGYDVTGVFIKVWHPDFFICDWKADRRDAMRVCARLEVTFVTLDLEKEYKKEVVDYMIKEYKAGRTPNPDVMCNKEIKFGAFLKYALKNGADFVATGHYAQNIKHESQSIKHNTKNTKHRVHNAPCFNLYVSKDTNKDQSYFLWTLKQNQLKHILFPVGNLTKPEVRKLAKKFNLPTAEKKDSQGLCFIGKVDMKEFLSNFIKTKKGKVLDINKKVIGYHDGAVFFTIGQRHGFTVINKKNTSEILYVISKNMKNNTITVYPLEQNNISEIGIKSLELSSTNWISEKPNNSEAYEVRFRYRQKLISATLEKKNSTWFVNLFKPETGISPGQSVVIYKKNVCVGGGIIDKTL